MSLIFFGGCSNKWLNVLNHNLLPHLQPTIQIIKNYLNYTPRLITYNYILPLMETHMLLLHKHRIKAMMPDLQTIKIFTCKKLFSQYVIKYNLINYTPQTFSSLKDIENFKNTQNSVKFIIKPYNLYAGQGMIITDTIRELDINNFVVQEYIHTNIEYCAYIVAKNGKIQYSVIYKYIFQTDPYVKTAVDQNMVNNSEKIILDQQYIDCLELFLLPCHFNGVCNIDFKIHNNTLKLFEINPRLGGSLMFKKNHQDLVEIIKNIIMVFNN
jgi:carbamoylphosphate synthase large subunit